MVKANAYGHGALPVSRALTEAGITWFGLSTSDEAELRTGGVQGRVLVVGVLTGAEARQSAALSADVTAWSRTVLLPEGVGQQGDEVAYWDGRAASASTAGSLRGSSAHPQRCAHGYRSTGATRVLMGRRRVKCPAR